MTENKRGGSQEKGKDHTDERGKGEETRLLNTTQKLGQEQQGYDKDRVVIIIITIFFLFQPVNLRPASTKHYDEEISLHDFDPGQS